MKHAKKKLFSLLKKLEQKSTDNIWGEIKIFNNYKRKKRLKKII